MFTIGVVVLVGDEIPANAEAENRVVVDSTERARKSEFRGVDDVP
jgi:hypothetical protein